MLNVWQVLPYRTYKLMWKWMSLIGFNHLINKYLKCLFVIDDALIWKLNVEKLVVLEALLNWNSIPTKTLVTKISRNLKLKFLFIW